MIECDGCRAEAERLPPAYVWIQNMDQSFMLVRASLCRSCLVAMLKMVRADLRSGVVALADLGDAAVGTEPPF